jgi:hypothetical protein
MEVMLDLVLALLELEKITHEIFVEGGHEIDLKLNYSPLLPHEEAK